MPSARAVLAATLAAGIGCAPVAKTVTTTAVVQSAPEVAAIHLPTAPPPQSGIVRHTPQDVPKLEPSAKPVIEPEAIVAEVERAHAAGLAWAIANQRPDGNWGTFATQRRYEIYLDTQASHRAFQAATTALVTWGLLDPSRTDACAAAAFERGRAVLEKRGTPGKASGNTFYDVWAHTYLMELGVAVVADPRLAPHADVWRRIVQSEVDRSRTDQGTEGGWGYYDFNFTGVHPSGQQSTSFNTAAMILALEAAKSMGATVPQGEIADGARAVLRMQLPSGAFAYGTYAELTPRADYNKVSGSSGRLQVCNLALHSLGLGGVTTETLLRGIEHLRDTHHYLEIGRGRVRPHEAFYRNSGYYYYFGHFYAARVLAACPASARRAELARWLASVMINDQNPDGSWFDYPLYGYGKAYATGYGLLTLQVLRPLVAQATTP
jgi:hypothetical protein